MYIQQIQGPVRRTIHSFNKAAASAGFDQRKYRSMAMEIWVQLINELCYAPAPDEEGIWEISD